MNLLLQRLEHGRDGDLGGPSRLVRRLLPAQIDRATDWSTAPRIARSSSGRASR